MANTWAAHVSTTKRVPPVHEPCHQLVAQFGPAEPVIRQMGSALGVIAMDEAIAAFLTENDPMALSQVRDAFRRYIELADSYEFIPPNPFENRTERGDPVVVIAGRIAALSVPLPLRPSVQWHAGTIRQESDGRTRKVLAAVTAAVSDGNPVVVVGSYGDSEQDADEVSISVLISDHARRFVANPKWGGGFWSTSLLWEHKLMRTSWDSGR